MKYPITQYRANDTGSVSVFKGLNRSDKGNSGEWSDCLDIDTAHYPCLAPRYNHITVNDNIPDGVIRACCEPLRDNGEYVGFTGIVLCDCIAEDTELNCCFYFKGKPMPVGTVDDESDSSEIMRTALWRYDTQTDGVSEEDIENFDIRRVEWSIGCINGRYAINGYDPELKRGKYFVFNPDEEDDTTGIVVVSNIQTDFNGLSFGYRTGTSSGYDEYNYIYFFRSSDTDLTEYFTEGDYLVISVSKGSDYYDTSWDRFNIYPYRKASEDGRTMNNKRAKYAVVREIVNEYNSSGTLEYSYVYFYMATADGKLYYPTNFAYWKKGTYYTSTTIPGVSAKIGTFVPSLSNITTFANRIWGVNEDEDSVYASVFDTPLKFINTDTQLDVAMSWQSDLSGADTAVGVCSAGTEIIVLKKNSLLRISGTNASSFAVGGIYKNCGCIDIRSVAESSGTVLYLGYNGFYSYEGSTPTLISAKLNCTYTGAVGFTDGKKYYAWATRSDGNKEFLIYDIRYGYWHKWSDIENAVGAFRVGNDLYVVSADLKKQTSAITILEKDTHYSNWECDSVIDFEGVNDFKSVNAIYIRAEVGQGEKLEIFTSVNGSEWEAHEEMESKGRLYLYKIPVRIMPGDFWQFKVKCSGYAVIHNIEYGYADDGRRHYGNR